MTKPTNTPTPPPTTNNAANKAPVEKPKRKSTLLIYTLLLVLLGLGLFSFSKFFSEANHDVTTISKEGVIHKIQNLNRLETVAFNIDAIITSKKQGDWQTLWQEQKGLFIAHGKVVAGVDFNQLTQADVSVTPAASPQEKAKVSIHLPAASIFDVFLDDIEVYDIDTGLLGGAPDASLFSAAQKAGKDEVLTTACRADILKQAQENAQKQVTTLFALANVAVTVTSQPLEKCVL